MTEFVVSLGDFRIGAVRVEMRVSPHAHAAEVAVHLTGLVDTRDRGPTKLTLIETVPANVWSEMPPAWRKNMIRSYVIRALEHELDEWLTFDGERLNDPHKSDPYKDDVR